MGDISPEGQQIIEQKKMENRKFEELHGVDSTKKVIEHFSSLGYKVFTIPEVPTMFTQAGMNYLTSNKDFFYVGEKATLQTQLHLEDDLLQCGPGRRRPYVRFHRSVQRKTDGYE